MSLSQHLTSNPASNRTFKLPGADGTAGQFLKTDGNGNLHVHSQQYLTYNVKVDHGYLNQNAGNGTIHNIYKRNLKIDGTGMSVWRMQKELEFKHWYTDQEKLLHLLCLSRFNDNV